MSELAVYQAQAVMPVMDIAAAIDRRKMMVQFVSQLMVEDTDFGTVPGTTKATLLKPGAEKLTTFFGLTTRFILVKEAENWGENGSEPFFYYLYKCELYRGGQLVGEGDGSCNSHESKYRYRKQARTCPNCGQESIIKGKAEYGGGWVCWARKDGCGAKFVDGDPAIEDQQVGRVLNEDVADQANTILKMAQKRALIAAVLVTVNASEFFTQDLEDIDLGVVVEETVTQPSKPTPAKRTRNTKPRNGNGDVPAALSSEQWQSIPKPLDWTELWGGKMWALIGYNDKRHAENTIGKREFKTAADAWEFLLDHQLEKLDAAREPAQEAAGE